MNKGIRNIEWTPTAIEIVDQLNNDDHSIGFFIIKIEILEELDAIEQVATCLPSYFYLDLSLKLTKTTLMRQVMIL